MHRILLVEDHASFRQTLAYVFDQEPDFQVVAQAGTLAEARSTMDGSESADLGVIDLSLPDGAGTELISELRDANPEFAALVLTASLDRTEYARAVEAGAASVLHKSADVDDILDATRRLGRAPASGRPEPRGGTRSAREHRADHTPRTGGPALPRRRPLQQRNRGQTPYERRYRTHPHDEHPEQARRALAHTSSALRRPSRPRRDPVSR
jgi:DNA-binding NarL/FixJ family response regulator